MRLVETNTKHKFKDILYGRKQNIFTFTIGTPENPMAKECSNQDNKEYRESFERYLDRYRLYYFKLKGRYGNDEHSYLIANINLDLCKFLFGPKEFDQESFIYGVVDPTKDGKFKTTFYLYFQNDKKKFELVDEESIFVDKLEADNFYSKYKDYKFNIPFKTFESCLCSISDRLYEDFNWNPEYEDNLKYLSLIEGKTLKHLWMKSCLLLCTEDQECDRIDCVRDAEEHLREWQKRYEDRKEIKTMVDLYMGKENN